jgi:hypothetical protein
MELIIGLLGLLLSYLIYRGLEGIKKQLKVRNVFLEEQITVLEEKNEILNKQSLILRGIRNKI